MQNALDKAGDTDTLRKVIDDRDSTITLLRQQLEEAEDKLVCNDVMYFCLIGHLYAACDWICKNPTC